MTSSSDNTASLVADLAACGLLPLQDRVLPSAVTRIVGAPVSGSWWAHPAKHEIFRILNELADHPDVFLAPLLNRKRTFIHRAHWPALVAIGRAREAWQLGSLPSDALELLRRVEREETVVAAGEPAKTLALALLVATEEVHTPSGRHVTQLTAWHAFARTRAVPLGAIDSEAAKAEFATLAQQLAAASRKPVQRRNLRLSWEFD